MFITLEGPDGAGKSSQAQQLAQRLRGAGVEVVLAREPGGTPLGEQIRHLLLGSSGPQRDALTDALLFNAARHQLVTEVIVPALDRDAWVICDRYVDSTLAYQGYGGGVALEALRDLAAIATRGLLPDRTLLFDLPADAGLGRRAGGPSADLTRFELSQDHDLAFHRRVRDGFLQLAAEEPSRWRIVDASAEPQQVTAAAWQALVDLLPVTRAR